MHGSHSLSGPIRYVGSFRSEVRSGKCTTQMVTIEKQRKTELTNEQQRKTSDQ